MCQKLAYPTHTISAHWERLLTSAFEKCGHIFMTKFQPVNLSWLFPRKHGNCSFGGAGHNSLPKPITHFRTTISMILVWRRDWNHHNKTYLYLQYRHALSLSHLNCCHSYSSWEGAWIGRREQQIKNLSSFSE